MRRSGRAALAAIALLAACGSAEPGVASAPDGGRADAAPAPDAAGDEASNIYAADYVGPAACGECHPGKHASWQHTLHAVMNQRADTPGAIVGDFDDAEVAYAGGRVRFERQAGAASMTLVSPRGERRVYRVTRTIGVKDLQEYVGVLVEGPEPPGDPRYATEVRLPFGFWVRERAWFHQQYFDSWYGEEYDGEGQPRVDAYAADATPWATRCPWCHNTYPFELRALRTLADPPLGQGPEQFFDLATVRRPPAARAAIVDDNRLPVDELVTVGISCESCHLGGRAHARDERKLRFVPESADLAPRADAPDLGGGRKNPVVVVSVCAQCHSTPAPRFAGGAAARNSSEALDLAGGACTSRIKCTDCHDPHVRGAGAGAPVRAEHLAACTGCHAHLASPRAARAHGRHGAGVTCLDCHMPTIVQGVRQHVRSHRIVSPADPAVLAAAAPSPCNLCHLDRSIRWTVDQLARGWGVRLAPDAAWAARYGDLDAPVGEVWLADADPAVRLVAAAAYARGPRRSAALPRLLAQLDAPVAHERMWMRFAVEDALGRRLGRDEYDPTAPPATRAAQVERLRARYGR